MSKLVKRENEAAAKETHSTYGEFPLESLFTTDEWFTLLSLQRGLRPHAVYAKLRAHDKLTADAVYKNTRGDVLGLRIVDRDSKDVKGYLDIHRLVHLARNTSGLIQQDIGELSKIKMNKEEVVQDLLDNATADKSDDFTVEPKPKFNGVDTSIVTKIRQESALASFPIIVPEGSSVDNEIRVLESAYPTFGNVMSELRANSDFDYKRLGPYLDAPSEFSTALIYELAKDNDKFDKLKKCVNDTSMLYIPIVLMDPVKDLEQLEKQLPTSNILTSGSIAHRMLFYSSPNALCLLSKASMDRANYRTVTPAQGTLIAGVQQLMDAGAEKKQLSSILDFVLNHPCTKKQTTHYSLLEKEGLFTLDIQGHRSVSNRLSHLILQKDTKWLGATFLDVYTGALRPRDDMASMSV